MYNYSAKVTKVVDGDTLDLDVDLGMGTHTQQRVRLFGIDAPERFTDEGKKSTQFVKDLLELQGNTVLISTHKDKKGKFGRYIAEVRFEEGGRTMGQSLVDNNLAIYKDY